MVAFVMLLFFLIHAIVDQIGTWAERRRKKRAAEEKAKRFGKTSVASKSHNPLFMAGWVLRISVHIFVFVFRVAYNIGHLLALLSRVLWKKGWQKFDKLTYPEREFDREWDKIQEVTRRFETYRMVMIWKVEDHHHWKRIQIHQRVLEVQQIERFSHKQLALLTKKLAQLVTAAERQYLSETSKVYSCPHCGRRLLLTKKAANTVVKCPYRACHRRIKVCNSTQTQEVFHVRESCGIGIEEQEFQGKEAAAHSSTGGPNPRDRGCLRQPCSGL